MLFYCKEKEIELKGKQEALWSFLGHLAVLDSPIKPQNPGDLASNPTTPNSSPWLFSGLFRQPKVSDLQLLPDISQDLMAAITEASAVKGSLRVILMAEIVGR